MTKLIPHRYYYNGKYYFRQNSDGTQTRITLGKDGKFRYTRSDGTKIVTTRTYRAPSAPKPNVKRVANNLWKFENAQNKGLRNGKYYPHKTANGNADVANGIDLDQNTQFRNEANSGITKARADEIASGILSKELPYIDQKLRKYTTRPDTVSPQIKEGLLDMYWQVKNGLYKYNDLFEGIAQGNLPQIRKESKVNFKNKQGEMQFDKRRWDSRNEHYFHY